jgi:CheY-like chemotaxis protein
VLAHVGGGGSHTVLVVDDEPGVCEILKDILEDEGYAVGVASDGRQALDLLRDLPEKPCVVILDLIMPVLDGNAVYRAMKADPGLADIPILITTSDPSRAPSGALIMRKPVGVDLLLDTIRKYC